jgi:hypothetical protein
VDVGRLVLVKPYPEGDAADIISDFIIDFTETAGSTIAGAPMRMAVANGRPSCVAGVHADTQERRPGVASDRTYALKLDTILRWCLLRPRAGGH